MGDRILTIVLPAYNEELGVGKVIEKIPIGEIKNLGFQTEILVIDNNSSDSTSLVAQNLGARVLKEKQQGYGYAIKKGLKKSKGEIIVVCDADGTYPVREIPRLLDYFSQKKLVFLIANRFSSHYLFLKTMPLSNRLGNFFLNLSFQVIFGLRLKDSLSGMFLIRKDFWSRLRVHANGYFFSQEIKIEALSSNKGQWAEVEVKGYDYRLGKSKLNSFRDGFDHLFGLIRKRISR